ncbi:ureidoglycolate hydrolase protein [Fulvimarina pelagi HTCC2506]|uniref:Ureidoglycolate lyase n=1 Tax=Fulvimarina pelagi HTCC2506 TaxID=314231 RepID=Q0FXZ5_9HYPH|nr:ureidoglycolate lyase [Fulvimarina pelagi]EAU39947.1 ureidoglycolate hydrolase protein [Fulvimarina pelagi HTCC2506]
MWELKTTPLSADAFRPFGEVIETDNASEIRLINKGTTTRFHDIAPVDVSAEGGHPLISIFRGKPFDFPIRIEMMERHPLGSQAFMPLSARPYLIVVAHDESGAPGEPVAFLAAPGQGISYHRNVWHHPLLALEEVSDFLVVDRGGKGDNLEESDCAVIYEIVA